MLNALVFSWFLTFGWVPQQDSVVGNQVASLEQSRTATVSEIGVSAEIDRMFIFGASVESFQYFNTAFSYLPYRADYKIFGEIKLNSFTSVIAEHECDHPVKYVIGAHEQESYMASATKIYIKFGGKTNVW